MVKKLNSKSQAGAKADYEIKPIVTTSADIEASPVLYAVMRLNEKIEVTDAWGNTTEVKLTTDDNAGYIPVFKNIEAAKHWAVDGKYQIVAICPS